MADKDEGLPLEFKLRLSADSTLAHQWLEKAESSAKAAVHTDTNKWVNEARTKICGEAVRED